MVKSEYSTAKLGKGEAMVTTPNKRPPTSAEAAAAGRESPSFLTAVSTVALLVVVPGVGIIENPSTDKLDAAAISNTTERKLLFVIL
jgi:hypothetical protein